MDLGIKQQIKNGNGNTIIYTALIAAALANMVPTPFDGIYFRRVNRLERDFDQDLISPERLEWQVAGEYYLWTTLWYATLFTGIYAMGGQYKTNARIILALISGGIVIGSIQKNIQINKQIKNK